MRRLADLPLATKMGLAVLVGAVAPIGIGAVVGYSGARQIALRQSESLVGARADQLASEVDAFNTAELTAVGNLARLPQMLAALAEAPADGRVEDARTSLEALLRPHRDSDPRILALAVFDATGRVVVSTEPGVRGMALPERAYVQEGLARRAAVSDPFGVVTDGTPTVAYTARIDGPGEPRGFVAIYVRMTALWQLIAEANGRAGPGSFAVLFDRHGVRIGHGVRRDMVFRPAGRVPPEEVAAMERAHRFGAETRTLLESVIPVPAEFDRARAPMDDGSSQVMPALLAPANDEWNVPAARRLRTTNWTLFYMVPDRVAREPLDRLFIVSLLGAVAIAGLMVLLGRRFARRVILEPLRPLFAGAEDLAAGRPVAPIPAAARDELGRFAGRFNAMVAAIASARADLERTVSERTRDIERSNAELEAQKRELQAQQTALQASIGEAERANQLKSQFLANMSHELRTPLNSIIGFTDLVLDEARDLPERHRAHLADVVTSGRHLLAVINDILDLSKIEAGRMEVLVEHVDPAVAVAEAIELMRGAAARRRITLRQSVTARAKVRADPGKLRQILLNLLSNAVKFGPEGSEVEVSAEDVALAVRFVVRDRGPGIEEALRPRLFQPFVQGENPLVKKHQGTGLGLAISKRLVEMHAGRIEVESVKGLGTAFAFTIPTAAPEERPAPAAEPSPPVPAGSPRPIDVLVIDDEPRVVRVVADLLRPAGLRVRSAHGVDEGLALARTAAPDVIVLDIVMPRRDGFAALEALAGDPALAPIPVMVLSGAELPPHERERIKKHARLLVTKGEITGEELLTAVRSLVAAPAPVPRGAGTVLVVDDNDMNREVARALLENLGYRVVTAESADKGIALAHAEAPQLVIMDLSMPGKDGYRATRELKADPATARIPILALTALAMRGDEAKARAAGVDGYLTKPVDRRALAGAIGRLLAPRPEDQRA